MKKITLLLLSLFFSIVGYAQFTPTVEGFEDTTGPDPLPGTNWTLSTGNWTVFTLGTTDASTRWETITGAANVNSGTRAARSNRGNVGQNGTFKNFLVSPLVNMPSNAELHFWTRLFQAANQNTVFRIMIAPEGADLSSESSYTTVQQWTELDLLAGNFNIYAEKVVGLSGFAPSGADIHIAFVMEDTQENPAANSDRWLIDDVSVVAQCPAPTLASLAVSSITQTSANLNWDNPSGATSWEIEIIPAAANPTGTGIVYNGILPYLATATQPAGVAFTPTTAYKYYVRAICSGGPNSAWIGPKEFSTTRPGLSCDAPIQVPLPLLYTTTDNTTNYADNNDVSQPAGCVAGNTNYMAGNEVYYSYIAPANGTISVTMTPNAANSSLFVYQGCANLAVACVGGVANDTAAVRSLPNIPVVAGQQYIIVLSSSAATQTYGYTLVIQDVNCAQPAAPTVSGITQTSANVSWPAGAATSWEVVWQPAGGPIPSGSGTQTNVNTNFPVTPLTANTSYDFYVRADCGNGTDFSAWTGPINIRTLCDAFPVPFQEGFNSTSTTEGCWTILNVNGDDDSWSTNDTFDPFEGDQSASINTEGGTTGTNDDWLISPQINLTGNQRLKFRYRVRSDFEPNDFRVMLSTSGTTPASFTTVLVPLTSYSNENYIEKVVNLTGFNQPSNIAFHVPAGGLDGWILYIDNFIIEDLPTCPEPTDLVTQTVLSTSATISWTNGNAETAWQIIRVPCGDPAPTATTVGTDIFTNPYTLEGLDPITCYDVYVRAVCSASDSSPWSNVLSFTTQVAPPVCGGTFTDPGGAAAQYDDEEDSTVTVCAPAGQILTVTFSSFNTEATYDGLYVYDGNSITSQQISSANGAGNGPLTQPGAFWGTTIPGPFTSSTAGGCLTFRFLTDTSATRDGWVANVNCANCRTPNQLITPSITSNSITLGWNQLPNGDTTTSTEWQLLVLPCGSPAPQANATGFIDNITTNSYPILNLDPNTCYDLYVRAVCSDTDFSAWAGITNIRTLCVPFPIPFQEGFDTGSISEDCWTVLDLNNDGNTWDLDDTFAPYDGNQAANLNTEFGTTGSNNDWLISPKIEGLNGNQRLRYRYRVRSDFEPNDFRVMLSTTGVNPADFTQTLVPLASYDNEEYLENIVQLTNISGSIHVAFHVPAGGLDGWEVLIDKVIVESNPTCIEPNTLTAVTTATSALLGWNDINVPTATQWEVLILPAGSPEPLPSLPVNPANIVNINPAPFSGLASSTEFVYFVRAICSDTDRSAWSSGFTFSTKPANDECIDAIFVPVNSGADCDNLVSGVVTGASASVGAPAIVAPCVGTPDDDVWFQFIATNPFLNFSLQNVQGNNDDLNFALYSGSCGALTQVTCGDPFELSDVFNGLVVGDLYYIRVYSTANTPQTISFDLCISTPSTCATASTVCNITYANTTGVEDIAINEIGCLFTAPNPTFFTIQVLTSGPINYLLKQASTLELLNSPDLDDLDLDVDYAAWGPFTSQDVACSNIVLANGDYLDPGIGVPVTLTTGCSYSFEEFEILNIANAQAGQFYIIVITNFENAPGFISLTQTNAGAPGAGTTFCCNDANFEYDADEYCKNASTANPVVTIEPNSVAGTFTSFPPGLVFVDNTTGEVDLQASAPGYYQITNTLPTSTQCPNVQPQFDFIRITEPVSATIEYQVTEVCDNQTATIPVTITGATGGTFSVLPNGGLFINTENGTITPSSSAPGIYTISYNLTSNAPCPPPAGATWTMEIKATPEVVSPGNQIVCGSYTLPSITVGNYYTAANGGGTMLNGGDVITQEGTQTIYIYADNDGCTDEKSFTLTINPEVVVDEIDDLGVCAPFELQPLTSGNYFSGPNGTGTAYNAGDIIPVSATPVTLYVYASNATCSDQDQFTITFGGLVVTAPESLSVCNTYTLETPTLGNYFTQAGGLGTQITTPLTITETQTFYLYANESGCIGEDSFTVTINTVPTAEVQVTQPTCAVQSGTIVVTSPTGTAGTLPTDLFISEVTDSNAGSLSYIEIYNGTGSAKNLADYKISIYNNGNNFISTNCEMTLSGTLNNNDVFVLAVGDVQNQGGVVPDLVVANCLGFNNNDNVRLTTVSNTLVDLWGRTDGEIFTPNNQAGYTYARIPSATVPKTTWDAADWTTLDPEDYTNVGQYTYTPLGGSSYQYSLDGGTYQTGVTFVGVAPGNHTITVQDMTTGCFSVPFDVVVDPIPLASSDTRFVYPTPVCKIATTNPSPIPVDASTFTINGLYSEDTTISTGLTINATTGVIDLANSTVGEHTVKYEVLEDLANCIASSSFSFVITINAATAPDVRFSYPTPVCKIATTNPAPSSVDSATFISGGTYSEDTTVSTGLTINATTGVIDLANSTVGQHTVKYEVVQNPSTCQDSGSFSFVITINAPTAPVLNFGYSNAVPTTVCANRVESLNPINDFGFVLGGTYTVTPPTGLVISSTGVISLNGVSTPGTYDIVYSVEINPGNCQTAGSSPTVRVVISPTINLVADFSYSPSSVCPDATIQSPEYGALTTTGGTFTASPTGLAIGLNTGDINVENSTPGNYTVTYQVSGTGACEVGDTDTATFVIASPFNVLATGQCEGASYLLTASPVEGSFDPTAVTYSWEDSTGLVVGSTQTIIAPKAETYTVTVTSNGCSNTADVIVETIACVIQKGISPNGDNENDAFELTGLDVKKLEIFNRYGMKVYTKNNYTNQWVGQSDNGDELPDGTYYYVIERNNGENKTGWIYINREQ
ncbi:choice-of-anchor J domain-containing protein [Flavobacterium dankookense]|uniref:Gliding motility-associated-like protein n=1 Tax=Flavobacterium dankookense TaxID=706186 RepID=A0A4R6QEB8_9FLAO|nr:choice-of-anchor J domain-containing protein [Flavobacterium dankookense]TDP60263.1 gliding motility-associated-like protein [Flavobacterium dankookense]